jgi:hypothetical protein
VDAPFNYDFLYFSVEQRGALEKSVAQLQKWLAQLFPDTAPDRHGAEDLFPFLSAVHSGSTLTLYHFVDLAHQGGLSISFHQEEYVPTVNDDNNFQALVNILHNAFPKLLTARALFNDNCWYTKWRPDYEIERKYTFKNEIPDTWALTNRLYQRILAGDLKGFVPELDMEFQVFDYESHIYEVINPPEEKGYISFIPQADGRMTIKQKWFEQNAEVRKETVTWNNDLRLEDSAEHATKMTGKSELQRLPVFRRKRFDVNFESLATGNIFGVYFDICRVTEPGYRDFFGQCEVEYCRSRTLWPIRDVMQEYEFVCAYTNRFLLEESVAFEQNLFSKLDFVRQAYEGQNETAMAAS